MNRNVLALDAAAEVGRITQSLRSQVLGQLRRRGAVVGISGGVDSSVVAALCAHAFGPEKVLGLLMPERDSSSDSLDLGRMLAASLGIEALVEDIGATLETVGCYRRQVENRARRSTAAPTGYRSTVAWLGTQIRSCARAAGS